MVATVLMNYLINKQAPDSSLYTTMLLSVLGALIAGWDTLDTHWGGYLLTWMINFSQSGYNSYVSKVNREKRIIAFGNYHCLMLVRD